MEQFARRIRRDRVKSFSVAIVLAFTGCAGRAPQPVAVVQPQDRYMDCTAIQAEILANNKTIQGLGSEEGGKVAQNVAAGIAGLIIWPIWFGMDFQGAAGKEEAALQSRQEYLASLALQRGCAAPVRPTVALAPAAPPPAIAAAPMLPAPGIQADPAQSMAPLPIQVPRPTMAITPCGEDRPCSVQETAVFGH
jgi:hypothetical protein